MNKKNLIAAQEALSQVLLTCPLLSTMTYQQFQGVMTTLANLENLCK